MTQIALPENAASMLAAAAGPVSVTDAAGHVLGTFIPASSEQAAPVRKVKSPFTREEIERRVQRLRDGTVGARPLSEVLAEFERRSSGHSP